MYVNFSYNDEGGLDGADWIQGSEQEIRMQARMIDNEIRMMRQEKLRLDHERSEMVEVSYFNVEYIHWTR